MILPNGSECKTVLLDTNVLHNLVTCPEFAGKLITRFCSQQPLPAFCFSFYNVIELRNKRQMDNGKIDIYASFIEFFSKFPCLMFFPYKCLIQEELSVAAQKSTVAINGNIANIFTPCVDKAEYCFEKWLENCFSFNGGEIAKIVQDELNTMPTIVCEWMKMRNNKQIVACEPEKIRKMREGRSVLYFLEQCGIDSDGIDFSSFPAARTMLFSQTQRVYFKTTLLVVNDVMDVCISAFAPYVDTVVTEAYQADVYRKAKKDIPQLKNLGIISIREI